MRIRIPALITTLLVGLCAGCGGSRPALEDLKPAPDPSVAEVRALLERCATPDLERLFELLRVFDALLDPAAQDPPLRFTGLRVTEGALDWVLDVGGDGTTDVAGTFAFRDAGGRPVFPWAPSKLGTGVAEVADLLAGLPDGTRVEVRLTQAGVGRGSMAVPISGGRARSGSGSVTYEHDGCRTTWGFTDVPAERLLALRPNALLTLALDAPEGTATGTLSLNGTDTAVLTVVREGRALVYTVDLDGFTVRGFQDPISGA